MDSTKATFDGSSSSSSSSSSGSMACAHCTTCSGSRSSNAQMIYGRHGSSSSSSSNSNSNNNTNTSAKATCGAPAVVVVSSSCQLPPEIWYHVLDQALNLLLPQATTPRSYMALIFPLLLTCHAFHNHCRPQTYPHLRKNRLLQLFTRWKAAHSREVHFYHHPLRTHVRYALPDRVGNPPGEEYETLYSFIKRSYLFGCDSVCGTVIPVEGGLDGAAGPTTNNAATNTAGHQPQQQQQQQQQLPPTPGQPLNQIPSNGGQGQVLIAPPPPPPAVAQTTPQQGGDGGGQGWKNHALQWHVANPTFAAEGTIELYRDVVEEYRRMVCGPPKTEWVYELERTLDRPRQQREQERRLREQQQQQQHKRQLQQQHCQHRLPSPATPPPAPSMAYGASSSLVAMRNDALVSESAWMHQRGTEDGDHEELLNENDYEVEGGDDVFEREELDGDDDEDGEEGLETDEEETVTEPSLPLVDSSEQGESMLDELPLTERTTSGEEVLEESQVLSEIEAKGGLRRRDSGHGQSTSEMDVDEDEEEEAEEEEDEDDEGMQSLDEEMELLRRRQEILFALRQQRRQMQQQRRQQRRYSNNDGHQQSPSPPPPPPPLPPLPQRSMEGISTAAQPLRCRRSKSQSSLEKRQCSPVVDAEMLIMDMALDRPFHTMAPLSPLNPLPPLPSPSSTSSSALVPGDSTFASQNARSLGNQGPHSSRKRSSSRRRRGDAMGSTAATASSSGGSERSDSLRPSASHRSLSRHYHRHTVNPPASATVELSAQAPLPARASPPPTSVTHRPRMRETVSGYQQRPANRDVSMNSPGHDVMANQALQQEQNEEDEDEEEEEEEEEQKQEHRSLQGQDDFGPHNLGFDLASACANTFASDLAFVLARVPGLGAHFHRFEQLSKLKLHVGWAKHAQSRGGNDVFVMSCSRLIALLAPLANTPLVSERGG